MAPLARIQYTLEQYRNGTASIAMGNLGAAVGPEVPSTAAYFDIQSAGAGHSMGAAETQPSKRLKRRRNSTKKHSNTAAAGPLEEDQTRLLPPVIVPQVRFVAPRFCFMSTQNTFPRLSTRKKNDDAMRWWMGFVSWSCF